MKVKLLKKVRKRYSIHKVNEIGELSPTFILECYEELNQLPFYYLTDNDNEDYIGYSTSYDNIYEFLVTKIHKTYLARMKRKDKKTQIDKVWY
jgi:hypothetical protein